MKRKSKLFIIYSEIDVCHMRINLFVSFVNNQQWSGYILEKAQF